MKKEMKKATVKSVKEIKTASKPKTAAKTKRVKIVRCDEDVDLTNPTSVAAALEEHNKWRHGIGIYKWHDNPAKNKENPFSAKMVGLLLEAAAMFLKTM